MSIEKELVEISEILNNEIRMIKLESFSDDELSRITINHYYYLSAIEKSELPTISSVAERLKVTRPSATVMVNKLMEQGFIRKLQSAEDKRVFYLYLTEKGRVLTDAEIMAYKRIDDKLALLKSDKADAIKEGLAILLDALR